MVESSEPGQLLSLQPISQDCSRHLSAVLPALSSALSLPVPTAVHPDPAAAQAVLGLPDVSSAIVVLIDGLGYWNLAERLGHAPYLRSLVNSPLNSRPITTCYPSTTVAAFGTFGTGTLPGLTGMLGYTQLNTHNGLLAQMIKWENAIPPEDLQRQPTLFERMTAQGGRVTTVGLPNFTDSALTKAALRGSEYISDINPMTRVSKAVCAARRPGLTYLYAREADKAGHHFGWDSDEWVIKLEAIDARMRALRNGAPKGTLLVFTADHGMVSMKKSEQIDIAHEPRLAQGVRLVGGEPRALMLYCQPGVSAEEVRERWSLRLWGAARILLRDEAVEAGLFGPVDPRIRPMIGDVVVSCADYLTIVDSRTQPEAARAMPSVHGSATKLEQEVPLLIDLA